MEKIYETVTVETEKVKISVSEDQARIDDVVNAFVMCLRGCGYGDETIFKYIDRDGGISE